MASNKRLYYACTQLGLAADGVTSYTAAHGVQSCGITTNFTLDQIFELGQIDLYENKENIPEVQLTAQKVLDGYPLLYHLATSAATSNTLVGRSRTRCIIAFATFDDTKDSSSGVPIAEVIMSGMFPNSISYNFNVDGSFTEDITFVGNSKLWRDTESLVPTFSGAFLNNDQPRALTVTGSGGVNIRQHLQWADTGNCGIGRDANGMVSDSYTVLPPDIDGISSSGTNSLQSDGSRQAHVQSIQTSVDLNRQDLFELGRRLPYFKIVQFPVQVSCAITTYMVKWDNVSALEAGTQSSGDNLTNRTIKIKTTEGTFIDLGVKNKLASIDIGSLDTGGGQATVTYNYTSFNTFTVRHTQDPNVALR